MPTGRRETLGTAAPPRRRDRSPRGGAVLADAWAREGARLSEFGEGSPATPGLEAPGAGTGRRPRGGRKRKSLRRPQTHPGGGSCSLSFVPCDAREQRAVPSALRLVPAHGKGVPWRYFGRQGGGGEGCDIRAAARLSLLCDDSLSASSPMAIVTRGLLPAFRMPAWENSASAIYEVTHGV